jgi:cytochrome c-type biogenesis protein CcmH/NrfG
MSLVNDMLKDLDERRRGVPVKGNAAKKLTPASDRSRSSAPSRLPVLAAIAGGAVVVVMVLWLLLVDRENAGELADLPSSNTDGPSGGNVAPANTNAPVSATSPSTSGNGAQDNAEAATIAALEARLAELEAANTSNTNTQTNSGSTGQSADWAPIDWSVNTSTASTASTASAANTANTSGTQPVTDAGLSQFQANQGQASGDQTQLPPTQVLQNPTQSQEPLTQFQAPQQNAPVATVERQSREMPLSERDRLTVQEALTLWSQGQQLSALQALDSFAYENPEAHQSRETLAKLLIRQGEVERALQATEIGLQIAPSHAGYKKVKARILIGQSNVPEALALLSATPPSVSNDPEYHSLLATAQLAGGEYTQAIQSYRALLRLDDTRLEKAPLWYGLGSAQQRLGNLDEARQAYQQALQQPDLSTNLRAQIERRLSAQ